MMGGIGHRRRHMGLLLLLHPRVWCFYFFFFLGGFDRSRSRSHKVALPE